MVLICGDSFSCFEVFLGGKEVSGVSSLCGNNTPLHSNLKKDSFSLRLYHIVDLVRPDGISQFGLLRFLGQTIGLFHLHQHLFGPYIESSTEQLPNADSVPFYLLNLS